MLDPLEDERLSGELRHLFEQIDSVPEHVIHAAKESYGWRMIDAELAALTYDSMTDQPLVHLRGDAEPRLVTFDAADLRFEVEISGSGNDRRLLGQLVPPQQTQLEIRHRTRGRHVIQTDEAGQFIVGGLQGGVLSLVCRRPDRPPVATEWFRS
jgi:hypothetical protein